MERLQGIPAVLRLPSAYHAQPETCPGSTSQTWMGPDSTHLIFSLTDGAPVAFGGDDPAVVSLPEGSCALLVGGRLTTAHLSRNFRPGVQDTIYTAAFDIPMRDHLWVGGAIIGLSRIERDRVLAAVGTLQLGRR